MKPLSVLSSISILSTLATSQLIIPLAAPLPAHPPPLGQLPIMPPPPPPPPSSSNNDDNVDSQRPSVALTDILGANRAITSFSSLARLHESTTSLLSDLATNTTILAPLNSAIESLPHKPWEAPSDYDALGADAYAGDKGQDRARENMKRFVEAHLVTASPWKKDDKVKTVGGEQVWWTEKDGKKVVMPDEVEVDRVASQVANGEIWTLKGVLKHE